MLFISILTGVQNYQVAAGSVNVTLDGYLDVLECVWPDSKEMTWVLFIQDTVLIATKNADSSISNPKGLFGTNSGLARYVFT